MTLRVATDIGGTFTDLVVVDSESGEVRIAKVSTTPRDLAQGVLDVIAAGRASTRPRSRSSCTARPSSSTR